MLELVLMQLQLQLHKPLWPDESSRTQRLEGCLPIVGCTALKTGRADGWPLLTAHHRGLTPEAVNW